MEASAALSVSAQVSSQSVALSAAVEDQLS